MQTNVKNVAGNFKFMNMNARSQVFEFVAELNQVEDVVLSIFHTLLFQRSTGKFHYKKERSYTIGSVGFEDVDCRHIDVTYVRCACSDLENGLRSSVREFKESLQNSDGPKSGQISLEFYQRKKNPWPFPTESVPWELWTVKIDIVLPATVAEKTTLRERLSDDVLDKIRAICGLVNRPDYVPKMPNESELSCVFDTELKEVQPYLHKISFQTSASQNQSFGSAVRRIIRDTLSY